MKKLINNGMRWALKTWTNLEVRDYISLLQLQNGYAVSELLIEPGDWLEGKSLSQADLSHEGKVQSVRDRS